MSSLFGQVWFWSLLAFLVGAVLTWVLLVRPAQQRVQQLERQPRNGRPAPAPPNGQAQPQQIPPRPAQQASPRAPKPPTPAWPGQQDPESTEHHERTRWLERDSLQGIRRSQAERTQQAPEQWPDASAQRPGVAEQRAQAQPRAFGQPDQHTPAPGQRPDVPDQRAFVPAEPPVPYGQEEDVQRELERQYREEFGHDYPEDDRGYAEDAQGYSGDAQGYPEDDDRAYQGDAQDYAPEHERAYAEDYAEDEFTGRVHPSSYADAAPGRPDEAAGDPEAAPGYPATDASVPGHPEAAPGHPAPGYPAPDAWRQQPPADMSGGVRDRLDDIDEQPELGDLGDFDAGSDAQDRRPASAQRPGGLFAPPGPAEQDNYEDDGYETNGYEDDGFETNGYAGAQPSGAGVVDDAAAPSDPGAEQDDAAPDTDPVTGLPRRRRGASNRIKGGFAPPRPIEPSIRPVARRTPQQDGGSSSGSLFEPSAGEQPGAVAQAGGYVQPGGHVQHAEAADVPPGPFGPGSAMPLPGGGRPDPSFTVKASVTELRYCVEGSPAFASMTPEVWFATPNDAERVGFRPIP
ncbi:MAG: hypothetical protein GEU97_23440 [Actinophytocola sp.]|nr:hypothetical protein [Actinophytocola sp.]